MCLNYPQNLAKAVFDFHWFVGPTLVWTRTGPEKNVRNRTRTGLDPVGLTKIIAIIPDITRTDIDFHLDN